MLPETAEKQDIVIFWFRRDLRLHDNTGLWHALSSGSRVLPVFIYDREILEKLERDDPRMQFLGTSLQKIHEELKRRNSALVTMYASPAEAFQILLGKYSVKALYYNLDYEPYATERDRVVSELFISRGIPVFSYIDQVIFGMSEVLKKDGKPYTVYTPYSRTWLSLFRQEMTVSRPSESVLNNCLKLGEDRFIHPSDLGFTCPEFRVRDPVLDEDHISRYDKKRDIPSENGTSMLSPHLRFGTVSIREVFRKTLGINQVFVKELIWREFFMQILYHFPHVTENSFRPEYDRIEWLNNEDLFTLWCQGKTGFPLVDAGMRELSETGYMHNRVRMVVANFLTRHLLTDWRWGEGWFAMKLLDYELSSNNGNWQWAAGTGCDAAPYFRIFNPQTQVEKFDPRYRYIKKWVPEFNTPDYPAPCVDHADARLRALKFYKAGIRP